MINKHCAAALLAFSVTAFAARAARADGLVQNAATSHEAPAQSPSLAAKLLDAEAKAKKASATVSVSVKGVEIVDPASAREQAKAGQGHLHYKVDDGPVIATTALTLGFHGLKPGAHTIEVILAGNDHVPLGPSESLAVTIPETASTPQK